VLKRILRGRLTFTPRVDLQGYDFLGPTRFDKLFTGVAIPPPASLAADDKRGTETIGPDDTFDGDYGRLLDDAITRKGSCARRDLNPRPTGSKPAALSS
jgi:hypothetical protein